MKNQYILKEDYAILRITSKARGIFDILIDLDDIEKCKITNWHVEKDSKYIIRGSKRQNFWKTLLNYQGKLFINHKNKNELDYRKNNLEVVRMKTIHRIKKERFLKHKNEFVFKKDYCIIKIFSKIYNTVEALIDIEDYKKVKDYSWSVGNNEQNKTLYVRASRNKKRIDLHRFIMGAKKGEYIDHINHNGLDNRKSNLRIVTASENCQNRLSKRYTGVRPVTNEKTLKWYATIFADNKLQYLGRFKTEEEAIEARRQAELKYWGEEALRINDENRKKIKEQLKEQQNVQLALKL